MLIPVGWLFIIVRILDKGRAVWPSPISLSAIFQLCAPHYFPFRLIIELPRWVNFQTGKYSPFLHRNLFGFQVDVSLCQVKDEMHVFDYFTIPLFSHKVTKSAPPVDISCASPYLWCSPHSVQHSRICNLIWVEMHEIVTDQFDIVALNVIQCYLKPIDDYDCDIIQFWSDLM